MFGKKEKMMDGKLVEKDVGFLEDAWEFLKHAVMDESHCLGTYLSTENEIFLQSLEKARKIRTEVMSILTKNAVGQGHCRIKHLAGKSMTAQELCTRFLSMGDIETAKKFADYQKEFYLEYLSVLGVDENNISNQSDA